MRYPAAYLLAVLGGNPSPKVADIAQILGSVGIDCDEKRAQQVIDACEGKNIEAIIAEGMEKIDTSSASNTPAPNSQIPSQSSQQTSPPPHVQLRLHPHLRTMTTTTNPSATYSAETANPTGPNNSKS